MSWYNNPEICAELARRSKKPDSLSYVGDISKHVVFEVENIHLWKYTSLQIKGAASKSSITFHKRIFNMGENDWRMSGTRLGIRKHYSIESLKEELLQCGVEKVEIDLIILKSQRFFFK